MTMNKIGFKRLNDDATLPTKAHPTDSGFDLYASEDVIIEPGDTEIVPTGIAVGLPKGFEAQVRPRSGVTAKTKLRVQLGTIDNGYTGEIGVIVDNIESRPLWNSFYLGFKALVNQFKAHLIDGTEYDRDEACKKGTLFIAKGDRIAQLVVQALPEVTAVEIENFSEESERGAGGFGSTGV